MLALVRNHPRRAEFSTSDSLNTGEWCYQFIDHFCWRSLSSLYASSKSLYTRKKLICSLLASKYRIFLLFCVFVQSVGKTFKLFQLWQIFKQSSWKCHSKPAKSYPFFFQKDGVCLFQRCASQKFKKLPLKLDSISPKLKKLIWLRLFLFVFSSATTKSCPSTNHQFLSRG